MGHWGRHFPRSPATGGGYKYKHWGFHWPEAPPDGVVPPISPGTSATLIPEESVKVTYAWQTGLSKTFDGRECRSSIVEDPAQRYEGSILLDQAMTRAQRATLARYAAQGAAFALGLPYEAVPLSQDSPGTTVYVRSTAALDWCVPGMRAVVRRRDIGSLDVVIQSKTSTAIEVYLPSGALGVVGGAGAEIMPAMAVYLDAQQGFGRYQTMLERWDIRARNANGGMASTATRASLPLAAPQTLSGVLEELTLYAREVGAVGNLIAVTQSDDAATSAGELVEDVDAKTLHVKYSGDVTTVKQYTDLINAGSELVYVNTPDTGGAFISIDPVLLHDVPGVQTDIPGDPVNLSVEGKRDWFVPGADDPPSAPVDGSAYRRKATGGSELVSGFAWTTLDAPHMDGGDNPDGPSFSCDDGDVSGGGSISDWRHNPGMYGAGGASPAGWGFTQSAAAGTSKRTLHLWFLHYFAECKIDVSLSDGSAPAQSVTLAGADTTRVMRVDIDFAANSTATLNVAVYLTTLHGTGDEFGGCAIRFHGAAVTAEALAAGGDDFSSAPEEPTLNEQFNDATLTRFTILTPTHAVTPVISGGQITFTMPVDGTVWGTALIEDSGTVNNGLVTPDFVVSAKIVSVTGGPNLSGYEDFGVGVVRDQNNYVTALWGRTDFGDTTGRLYLESCLGGSRLFDVVVTGFAPTGAFWIALSKTSNKLFVWTSLDGVTWTQQAESSYTWDIDAEVAAHGADWKPFINVSVKSNTSQVVGTFDDFKFANSFDWRATGDEFDSTNLSGGADAVAGVPVGLTATLATYRGKPVWDRGIDVADTVAESVQAMNDPQDLGGLPFTAQTARMPDWGRQVTFARDLSDEWQWTKKFLWTVRGSFRSWWLPTYRDDLVAVSKATGTLTVSGDVAAWYPLQRQHLACVVAGVPQYVRITNAAANGDGTTTLTIVDESDAAVTLASLPQMVCWLELCRLETDQVSVAFTSFQFSTQLQARVIQETSRGDEPGFLGDEDGIETSIPREGIELILPAVTYRLSTGTRDLTINGQTFTAYPSNREEVGIITSGDTKDLTVRIPLKHAVPQRYLQGGVPPRRVQVVIWRQQQTSGEYEVVFSGDVDSMGADGRVGLFRCVSSVNQVMQTRLPVITVGRLCPHVLYDVNCGLDENDFKISTAVTDVNGRAVTVATTLPDDYATTGKLKHISSGEQMTLQSQIGTINTMQLAIQELKVGDTVEVFAGCDHTIRTCRLKFDNRVNSGADPQLNTVQLFRPNGFGIYTR